MAAMEHRVTRGTCEYRGKSTYRCQYRVDGQPVPSITVRASGKKDARKLIEDEKARRLALMDRDEQRVLTVAEVLRRWGQFHIPTLPAERSKVQYTIIIEKYLIPVFGNYAVDKLSTTDIVAWRDNTARAVSSRTQHLRILKAAFQWACVEHQPPLMPFNPASPVKPPAGESERRQAFTFEEAMRLLDATQPPIRCLIALGMLGLRRGEALGVRRGEYPEGDLDFKRRRIYVRQKLIRHPEKGIVAELPKMRLERHVPMPEWIVPILTEQQEYSLQVHNQLSLLLVSERGDKSLDPTSVSNYMRRACVDAGIVQAGRPFHSLRHSYGSWLRRSGVADIDIAHSMGHKNTNQLVRLYGNHPDDDRDIRLASELDRMAAKTQQRETHQEGEEGIG